MTSPVQVIGRASAPASRDKRLSAWTARTAIWIVGLLGGFALAAAIWLAVKPSHDDSGNTSAAMYTLLDTGTSLETEIARTVQPAIDRTSILAKSPEVIQSLLSGESASQTAILNSKITTSTEIDAIALFNSSGLISAVNTVYADGEPISKDRIARVLAVDFTQRQIIQGCLRNNSIVPILEFQTHCDITPAFFDSTGLSIAYSVPVISPTDGKKLGVISSRVRFERLSGLVENRPFAGGSARAYFITDAGGYFSEAINSGRAQPPIPVTELKDIVKPILKDASSKTVTKRDDKYLAIFSLPSFQTLDGGGIHILIVADGQWLTKGPQQDRLIRAAGIGLIGTLLMVVSGFGHARLAAIRSRRTADVANEANARLAAIVESSTEAIIGDSLDGIIRSWNRGAERIFGFTAEEAIGQHAELIEPAAGVGEMAKLRNIVMNGGSIEQFETKHCRKDGGQIDISLSIALVRDSAGEILGMSRVIRDITSQKCVERELQEAHNQLEIRVSDRTKELKELSEAVSLQRQQISARIRAEEFLRQSEERFRQLAENTDDVFWMLTADGQQILYINPRYEEIWGRTCEDLREHPHRWMEVIQPEDHPHVMAAWTGLLAGGEFKVEYRIRRPDGEIRWIRNRAIPIHDSEGKVYRIAGIAEDITARRLSEIQLGEAQKAAEAADQVNSIVFDTALDAIITIDSQSVITAWNLQAETMFRWDRTEVVGMRLDQTIIPEKQWDAHRNEIEKFLKTGDGPLLNKVAELVAIRRDGREFPVEIAITPAWTNDECTFTAFIRDITVRKQADVDLRQARDAAEAANRAKSEFLANMSHEIRTPLNGVIGMSGLLLDTALDEKQRHFAELIKTSGESLADLINDILDFSKIEARKLEIESLDFDLYAAIEDVAEMMLIKASQKGLDLACLTMPDVPRRVKGDCQRVKQILINLINNAIKFTESGSISARLTLEKQTEAHLSVRFSVTDTGIGIPADRLDRLFKSFSQVDASTTRNYGGTGLGLAISKQLTELMGGSIGVESTVGRGSTFWFTIKLAPASYRREPGRAASIDSRELRALAAHADLEMREILGSQLCSWGLEASMASTGDEVLRMLFDAVAKGHPFNVALIDTELHDIDTLELGKAIKAHSEIAATVLVALLPINCDVELLNLREAGFSSHLLKPVRQSRLFDSIMDAIASTSEPKEVAAKPLPILSTAAAEHAHIVPQSLRILLAEDNRVNQIVTTEILAKHGYGCDIVCDGKKAVESALTGNYDLVLMDCSMPLMDGFEATRKIRAAQANSAQHIPIIALTANAINGDRERCFEAGMDEYLSKPIDPNRLINAVKNWAKSVSTTPNQTEIETSTVIPAKPSNLPGDPSAPVLIDTLLDRCMGDVEVVSMILNEFEQRTAVDLAEIKQCIEKVDCEGIARVAHALKGASGILAADAVAGVALKLEQMGRKGVLADEQQLLSQLNDEVKRCLDYFPVVREVISKGSKSEVSGNLENANTHR